MKNQYKKNKEAKIGDVCHCPSCKTVFIKEYYQQAFCKTKVGTQCKDFFWNNTTPERKNKVINISPARERYLDRIGENEHPHSMEALGQWN